MVTLTENRSRRMPPRTHGFVILTVQRDPRPARA